MRKLSFLLIGGLLALVSCQQKQEAETKEAQTIEAVTSEENTNTFGIQVAENSAIAMEDLTQKLTEVDSIADLTLKAKVKEVCQAKGCWMVLEQADGTEMRVTFKDYALFMPKDLAGKEVVVHGIAQKKVVPVDELRHYAEDAGKSAEEIAAITEPQNKLRFEADGVLIK